MKNVLARQIEIDPKGNLVIDRVALPWFIGEEVEIEDLNGLYAVHLSIFADRVIMHTPGGKRDTVMEETRKEAIAIVRAGLADVIEQVERGGRS